MSERILSFLGGTAVLRDFSSALGHGVAAFTLSNGHGARTARCRSIYFEHGGAESLRGLSNISAFSGWEQPVAESICSN